MPLFRRLSLLFCLLASCLATAFAVETRQTSPVEEAVQLVKRVTPAAGDLVSFELTGKNGDGITISKKGNGILIAAGTTRQLVAGYGWYLRNIAKVHFSWNGDRLELPIPLPAPEQPVTIHEPWKINFAFNYCTLSYTAAFWDWERWQREIDFLALNGFTHALVTAGLEKTWQNFLTGLDYPADKIAAFIPNPAYAAWWNMGNLEGFGGPLTQGQIDRESKLGKNIVTRMKNLGMTPVLQGYVGFIPADLTSTINIPGLLVVEQGQWVGFKRPWVADPTCKAFPELAERWYKALHETYGTSTSAYGGDLFHEGGRKGNINVTDAAKAVQQAMQKASPDSTWILQSWQANPAKELLLGTDPAHTLVLQLTKNMADGGNNLRLYEGRPWVWCELANFGGKMSLYGGLPLLSRLGSDLKQYEQSGLTGMGILSEGVEINPIHYELFFDRLWTRDDINLKDWIAEYAQKRYGSAPESVIQALNVLSNSIYSPKRSQEGSTESIICARPGWNVTKASTWSTGTRYYTLADVADAARKYNQAAAEHPELLKQETFRYDLIDVTRQLLADAAYDQLQVLKDCFDAKDIEGFEKQTQEFLYLITAMDELLSYDPHFRLDTWVTRARAKGTTDEEKRIMEQSARRLVTTWIDKAPQALNDYSNRQWSGLLNGFYLPRWKAFLESREAILKGTAPGKADTDFKEALYKHELGYPDKQDQPLPAPNPLDCGKVASNIVKHLESGILPNLIQRSNDTSEMAWDLKEGSPFEFNVTDRITEAGPYEVVFRWEKGQSALKIHSVTLYEGDREVARDDHEGWTGINNDLNTYRLVLPRYRTGLDSYTLKAKVSGASGTDSSGKITVRKAR